MFKREKHARWIFLFLAAFLILTACVNKGDQNEPLLQFTRIDARESGIRFSNTLHYRPDFNIYTYRNFFNGGGVAIGDVNRDGLPDIYLTANMESNRLFLNKGNLRFEDVTEKAGVGGRRAWSTGVTMVDINGDGWLDIYVCNSGDVSGDDKENEFFINQGDGTFVDRAEEMGLADRGYSTHAAFFDYDRDGDLDCYLLNNSYKAIGSFIQEKNQRHERDSVGGDKLFRNDAGRFTDVSEEAGIYGSVIGFGLGVTVGDVDLDGWMDIFVSNDFFERDYLYINQRNGTFREVLTEQMRSISGASMGADMADMNGDGYPEIFVTEMLPRPEQRIKTKTTFENWDRYQLNVRNDYYHQFTRNVFHLNNGDGTFSEVGRMLGVEATDWSWGALFLDMDNDGLRDLFVANGITRDLTDQDFLNFIADDAVKRSVITEEGVDYQKLIDFVPSEAIPNYAFRQSAPMQFEDVTSAWGLDEPSFSNGAAYGDLDNDGDLDLVVNNANTPLALYRNNTSSQNFLVIQLKGKGMNTTAIGAHVRLFTPDGKVQHADLIPMRGFESSSDPRVHFGLGASTTVDSIVIGWPDGSVTRQSNIATNQILEVTQDSSSLSSSEPFMSTVTLFRPAEIGGLSDVRHQEIEFVDFDRDRLIYHMLSTMGPHIVSGDLNGDKRDDIVLCGAKGQSTMLFMQRANGTFFRHRDPVIDADSLCEDTDIVLFDADKDGDLDLYIASGGSEFSEASEALADRLYFNNGKARFTRSQQILPAGRFESTSTVAAADFDQDGDQDLAVGIRQKPGAYGVPCNAYLLENDGKGNFTNVSATKAPDWKDLGLITDLEWGDINGDVLPDIVITGDWMTITVFLQEKGIFRNASSDLGLAELHGWWNVLKLYDLDRDGDLDIIGGNHGLNSRFHASNKKPLSCYINDFDANGTVEQVLCAFNGDTSYPMVLRHDLVQQMPGLKKRYLKYADYQGQLIEDIFPAEVLSRSIVHKATELRSSVCINEGGKFTVHSLPWEAQISPVYAIACLDVNKDGKDDILVGGNLYEVKPEFGRYDASYGAVLIADDSGDFVALPAKQSGLRLDGQIRDLRILEINTQQYVIAARNNDAVQIFLHQ